MLEKDSKNRISWEEMFDHPLIKPGMNDDDEESNQKKSLLKSSTLLKMEILKVSKI